jgi:hypothetical protein
MLQPSAYGSFLAIACVNCECGRYTVDWWRSGCSVVPGKGETVTATASKCGCDHDADQPL